MRPRSRRHPILLAAGLVAALVSSVAAAPASSPRPAPTPTPAPVVAKPATPAYAAYFNWYDNASPGMKVDNIHLVNPGAAAVSGSVRLGSTSIAFSNLAPGAETFVSFPAGTIGGPVEVDATAPVNAAQRVTYYRSFSEVAAQPATAAVTAGWWPWYDNASPGMVGDNIHLLNPDPAVTANVTLYVGSSSAVVHLAPGQESWASWPGGTIGGPVRLVADHPVLAAQRVQTATSFNELPVLGAADSGKLLVSNWYDNASPGFTADNIHMVNVSAADAHVTLTLGATGYGTFTVPAGGQQFIGFPVGTIGGPLELSSDQAIVATQRVSYYDAFQETAFHPATATATDLWFNWYDDASPCFIGDNVHLTNPSTSVTVTGTMTLPGQPTLSFSLAPGQESILNWPRGTIGGPVHVSASAPGVIADKRVVICPPPPPPPPPSAHKIVVSLSLQHLWAYDNGNLLLETDVTTGRPELPTPPGTYHIFYKTSPYEMISPWPYGSPYWYPDAWVNWVLEFIQGGYFLHDAPWRSWFGPGSQYGDGTHGCVNIPNGPMLQLYNWANLGDEVDVVN